MAWILNGVVRNILRSGAAKFQKVEFILILVVGLYIGGGFALPHTKEYIQDTGVIHQTEMIYADDEGEEREDVSLIEIEGIGKVLDYKNIYIEATISLLIISCLLGRVIFNSTDEIRFMIYTNCVLGILLLCLTTKPYMLSTFLYWCGIIVASFLPDKRVK